MPQRGLQIGLTLQWRERYSPAFDHGRIRFPVVNIGLEYCQILIVVSIVVSTQTSVGTVTATSNELNWIVVLHRNEYLAQLSERTYVTCRWSAKVKIVRTADQPSIAGPLKDHKPAIGVNSLQQVRRKSFKYVPLQSGPSEFVGHWETILCMYVNHQNIWNASAKIRTFSSLCP